MADKSKPTNSGSSRMKILIIVAAILIVEGVAISGAFMLLAGPSEVQADSSLDNTSQAKEQRITEVLVIDDKLPNARSGVTYLYDTEVYLQVRQKHAATVQSELEQYRNEIKAEITAIWRTAEPHHFQEPKLQTLRRKVYALLNERFGADEQTGEPIVEKCVIIMGTGFRIDS